MLKIYRASAGSGKTYQLAKDYISLLFKPFQEKVYRRILAVTFTNKATEEMKSRILRELNLLATGQESGYRESLMQENMLSAEQVNQKAGKILYQLLHDYSSFSIMTIDRYFQQIIRSFAREIGVHGGYQLELDSIQVMEQAVDNLFAELSEPQNKQLLIWLTQFAEEKIENAENWNVRNNIAELGKEIFKESFQHKAQIAKDVLHDKNRLADFKQTLRKITDEYEEKLKKQAVNALTLIENQGLTTESFKGGSRSPFKYLEKLKEGETTFKDSLFKLLDEPDNLTTKTTAPGLKSNIENLWNNGLRDAVLQLKVILTIEVIAYNSAGIILKNLNTLGILTDLALQVRKLTTEQNTMLIADSNLLLNKIIDESDSPFIFEKTGVNIDHFMIDEFQDTSVLQWKNFLPLINNSLSAGNANLVVGDIKQSIYRWRNSDWKLLSKQVFYDFDSSMLHDIPLQTNWRSDTNIIHFNNALFSGAAQLLQEKLNLALEPSMEALPQLNDLTNIIASSYQDVEQKTSSKAGQGEVVIEFIDADDSEEKWTEMALQKLPAILEDLQDRNFLPHDIAILVRKNGEEERIVEYLLHYKNSAHAKAGYSYDILGNEGLQVDASVSVRLILTVMRLFIRPDDAVQKTILRFGYPNLSVSTDENEVFQRIRNLSLFEMTEELIRYFGLNNDNQEAVFLQAFQDVVYKYTTGGKSPDLNSFLKWWEKFGAKQCVSAPENEQAFRIMTIHKSKGLDFKVTIVPFCEWDLDSRMRNIIWCESSTAPFNTIPLIPVEYNTKLGQSVFAEQYFREMMHTFMDSINMAYVAFTRPKHLLYVMTPLPVPNAKGETPMNSLSRLLWFTFNQSKEDIITKNQDTSTGNIQIGEPVVIITKATKNTVENDKISYPSVGISNRLKLKHGMQTFSESPETNERFTLLNHGNLMHEILCRMKLKSDQDAAIQSMLIEGKILQENLQEILDEFSSFWQMEKVNDWFSTEYKQLNESTILTAEGNIYRPDKVLLKDGKAIIIDYKFGENELEKYYKQVKKYMQLTNEMGYESEGYLCYVRLKKVVEITG